MFFLKQVKSGKASSTICIITFHIFTKLLSFLMRKFAVSVLSYQILRPDNFILVIKASSNRKNAFAPASLFIVDSSGLNVCREPDLLYFPGVLCVEGPFPLQGRKLANY